MVLVFAAIVVGSYFLGAVMGYQHGRRQEQIAERQRRLASLRSPFYGPETFQDISSASGTSWDA